VRPVAFFDSGVGGLPYLDEARSLMPERHYIYLADRAGFPYGTKSPEQVCALAVRAVCALAERFDPVAIVVACNTATEVAIDAMRSALPKLPIVGTVPAIKPAAMLSVARRIAVVATPRAAEEPYLLQLARQWAADCELTRIGDGDLVSFIEQRLYAATPAERLAMVRPSVDKALAAGADVLVLGCTHFLHMTEDFRSAVPPDRQLTLVDSRQGVARQLQRILQQAEQTEQTEQPEQAATGLLQPAAGHQGAVTGALGSAIAGSLVSGSDARQDLMYLTGADVFEQRYEIFAKQFGLVPAGSLYD